MGKLLIETQAYTVAACPFCGRYDRLTFTPASVFMENYQKRGSAAIAVQCTRCDVRMIETTYKGDCYAVKLETLLARWNRRKGV